MIDVFALKVGDRLALREGITAEVVENMDDGMWVEVRYLAVPSRPDDIGTVELCHAQDIVKVIEAS